MLGEIIETNSCLLLKMTGEAGADKIRLYHKKEVLFQSMKYPPTLRESSPASV